jgi:hypothetical protein
MLVATDADSDNSSSINGSTDSEDSKLQALDNPIVCRSAWIQRNTQILSTAPRLSKFEIAPLPLTKEQRRQYVRYEEDDKGNLIWVEQIGTAISFV